MSEVQVAVRLGRKTGADLGGVERRLCVLGGGARGAGPAALGVLARSQVGFDDVTDEIVSRRGGGVVLGCVAHGEILD